MEAFSNNAVTMRAKPGSQGDGEGRKGERKGGRERIETRWSMVDRENKQMNI